jgi:hypothetical protein
MQSPLFPIHSRCALLVALFLGACAQSSPPKETSPGLVQPPSTERASPSVTTVAPAPTAPAAPAAEGGRFHIGSDPYAPSGTSGGAGSGLPESGRVVIEGEETLSPEAARTAEAQRRADTAACYEYARAQTRHDQQIIDDQGAAFEDSTFEPSLARAQRQGELYGLKRRERRLIQDCMKSKGYLPQ